MPCDFRMEKVELRSLSSQAKILGTIISITALIATFYKDSPIIIFQSPANSISHQIFLSIQSNLSWGDYPCICCYMCCCLEHCAVLFGVSFLGHTLHFESVIEAIVIAVGFYAVMWGKAKEEKKGEEGLESSTLPLLRHTDIS
ncbi:hypothetical protein GIB67_002747 [Kingdonia uniflora]|uniref:WAT1-related protein n=1 Tax=Kingdonia uniflora TaxID=39325 RepID=A0A7J7N4G5_9MAGN|nr:hypothetical protein GIB67_002747 [Kingdonia uniflora]